MAEFQFERDDVAAVRRERRDTAPAALAPDARRVLALQASAGNSAVTRWLSRAPQGPAADKTPVAHTPELDGWSFHVKPGGLGAGVPRHVDAGTTKVFLGDTVTVRARLKNVTEADHPSIGSGIMSGGGGQLEIPYATFESATVLKWDVKPAKVGTETVTFNVDGGDGEIAKELGTETQTFEVVTDLQDFTLGCTEAQSTLAGKFAGASRRLNEAATAFREAYGEQEEVLNKLSASDRMLADVTWGVLFAAAGGYAGSVLGAELKAMRSMTKLDSKGEPAQLVSDAVIDAAKDTAKFAIRSGDRLRGGSGKSLSSGDSTAPEVTDPIRTGGGEYKPAGENPQDFLTKVSARVAEEGELAQAALTKLIREAREARRASSKADFDEDPVEVVTRSKKLDQIVGELSTSKDHYLAELWKAWLKDHGWQTAAVWKAIARAAEAVSENPEDWVQKPPVAEMKRGPGQGPIRPL